MNGQQIETLLNPSFDQKFWLKFLLDRSQRPAEEFNLLYPKLKRIITEQVDPEGVRFPLTHALDGAFRETEEFSTLRVKSLQGVFFDCGKPFGVRVVYNQFNEGDFVEFNLSEPPAGGRIKPTAYFLWILKYANTGTEFQLFLEAVKYWMGLERSLCDVQEVQLNEDGETQRIQLSRWQIAVLERDAVKVETLDQTQRS